MPHDRSSGFTPLPRLVGGLLAGAMLLTATGCVWNNPTGMGRPYSGKSAFMFEEPLEIAGPIHELSPRPDAEVGDVQFSERTRYVVWADRARNMLMGAEIGGSPRELAPIRGRWLIDWTANGQKFMLTDLSPAALDGRGTAPYLATIYSLDGSAPVVIGETKEHYAEVLPDGSGLSLTRLQNESSGNGGMMPGPDLQNRDPRRLMIRLPGQAETEEAVLNGPGVGLWSPDAQHYAHLEHRNGDPINGLDLKVYSRDTRTSVLRYHIESDNLRKVKDGLSWGAENTLWFTQACQVQASASIAVSSIPIDGRAVTLAIVPLSLEAGETIGAVKLSPDKTRLSIETSKVVTLTDEDGGSATGPKSSGILVASLKTGKVRRLTTRGRVVSWLPSGNDLVAATSFDTNTRYYRIDIPSPEEL